MHERFTDLSSYLRQARLRLAHTLGRALQSSEAVTLKVGPVLGGVRPSAQAEAAATIGATVLTEVDHFWKAASPSPATGEPDIEAAADDHPRARRLTRLTHRVHHHPTTLRADL